MAHRSRGCMRCRQRRVKCDQSRPSCLRCVTRNEQCVGYRDESDLVFQHETDKVIRKNKETHDGISGFSMSCSSEPSERSLSRSLSLSSLNRPDAASSPSSSIASWTSPAETPPRTGPDGDAAAVSFMDKYVVYPCSESSIPGFLEHLPCLFRSVNVQGRYALRFAVQAAGYADMARKGASQKTESKALDYYGQALSALGASLAEKGKGPDDYDLMTVVVLDIFETLYLPETDHVGSHAQGMAHILRIRGHEQFYEPRGWSLFRLAHHRLQKHQLSKGLASLAKQKDDGWFPSSDLHTPGRDENENLEVTSLCQEANDLLSQLKTSSNGRLVSGLPSLMHRIDALEKRVVSWREGPQWSFQKLDRRTVLGDDGLASLLPSYVQVHRDLWMAYEWNYHRTARIILHQQLLACLETSRATSLDCNYAPHSDDPTVESQWRTSAELVARLADEVLSTVPQSFGDIDQTGRATISSGSAGSQAIGAYLLLWPMKIIKGPNSRATPTQQKAAQAVFHRIRDCTGMRANLGSLSII